MLLSVEFLGHETLVYFQLPETNEQPMDNVLVARVAGKYLPVNNSENAFYIHPEAIYLFNQEGRTIYG